DNGDIGMVPQSNLLQGASHHRCSCHNGFGNEHFSKVPNHPATGIPASDVASQCFSQSFSKLQHFGAANQFENIDRGSLCCGCNDRDLFRNPPDSEGDVGVRRVLLQGDDQSGLFDLCIQIGFGVINASQHDLVTFI